MSAVVVQRAYRFRLYPTAPQAAELAEWERQLRWLYNLAHEQRLLSAARWRPPRDPEAKGRCPSCAARLPSKKKGDLGERHTAVCAWVDYFRQAREMTEVLSVDPRLGQVVCSARQEVLRDLDKAWQRWRKRLGGRPRFKRRIDRVRIYLATPKHWKVELGALHLAGVASSVGPLRIRQDRPWPGNAKFSSCHIVCDVAEWYAVFPLEYTIDAARPTPGGAVGINRGAIHAIADSYGRVVESPKFYAAALERIQLLSRRLARKEKGSRNRHKAALQLAKAHQRVRRQREWFLHNESAHYTRRYAVIGIEDLSTRDIVARPEAEEQHHFSTRCKRAGCEASVLRQRLCAAHYEEQRYIPKRAVRRSILDVGWYEFGRQLAYKAEPHGGHVVQVQPGLEATASFVDGTAGEAGISSTCSGCGAAVRRASGHEVAYCDACCYAAPGDVNAARNVLLRALRVKPAARPQKVTIKIKGRARAQTENAAKPAVEACGGDAPVGAPVEAGTDGREAVHPDRTVEP